MTNEKRLIDANALLELYNMGEELEEYADVLSVPIPVIRQNINDMPTIDAVEVVHGRWEQHGYKWKCSRCGVLMDIDGTPEENLLYYCPNCGAKMDGDNNG